MSDSNNKKADFGFQDIPQEDKASKVSEIFTKVAPKYDLMNDAMSLGMHRCWKQYLVRKIKIKPNYNICDIASGTGDVALLMASKLGDGGHITLSDINPEMLKIGRDKIFDKGLIKIADTIVANVERLPFDDNVFDVVTIAFGLRNVTDKKQALKEMYRVVKPGGKVFVMEFSQPENDFVKTLYDKYSFNIIPKIGEFLANDYDSYQYLVESIRRHPKQDILRDWFYEVGFDECRVDNILTGIVAIHEGIKF